VPTPAGRALDASARRLLREADRVDEQLARLAGERRPVRLAASHTAAEFFLPEALSSFEQGADAHAVEVVAANSSVVRDLVRDGLAELGVAAVDPDAPEADGLVAGVLGEDEIVVAVPPSHPWAARDEVPISEFLATAMVMRDPGADSRAVVERTLAQHDLPAPRALAEIGSTGAAIAAAIELGVPAVLSRLAVAGDGRLEVRRVRGVRFPRALALLVADAATLRPAARALREHLVARS
jgi:DNA-binding transcriptional LysR family regulator